MHFSSVMGPTQPNRIYSWAGTSFGAIRNGLPPLTVNTKPPQSLFTRLNDAKVGWRSYVFDFSRPAGSAEIRVTFDNDAIIGSQDRNLYIDKVQVGCP